MIIGIISDTHNLLREEAIENLKECSLIIHAGDIGSLDIIKRLEKITRVEFIKGNCDKKLGTEIKEELIINIENKKIFVIHDINEIKRDLYKERINIVVYGHSHKMDIFEKNSIIYINPGSIGPRRFKLPITMVKLYINEDVKTIDNLFKSYTLNNIEILIESIELQ